MMNQRLHIFCLVTLGLTLLSLKGHAQEAGDGDDARYFGRSLRITGGFNNFSHEVSGSGGTIDASDNQAIRYGLEAQFQKWGFTFHLSHSIQNAEFQAPTGSTPLTTDIAVNNTQFVISNAFLRESSVRSLADIRWRLGYFHFNRTADATSPTITVTEMQKSGLILGADILRPFNSNFYYNMIADLKMVTSVDETPVRTGFFESGWALDTKFVFIYPISRFVDLSAGLTLTYDKMNFLGQGTRNVSDATETNLIYGFPLEIWINF
jgi:hypothetical protein